MTAHLETAHDENTGEAPRLGPGTLLWRYLGDLRLFLVAAPYGMLELMHPAVGAGVTGHSDFFGDPWDRVSRSIPEIIGTVYDPVERGTGTRVRDYPATSEAPTRTGSAITRSSRRPTTGRTPRWCKRPSTSPTCSATA